MRAWGDIPGLLHVSRSVWLRHPGLVRVASYRIQPLGEIPMTRHPTYPVCPLPIRDGEHSHHTNHVTYSNLLKRLGANMATLKFVTQEDTMKALVQHAFKMALPFDRSTTFSAVAIRLKTRQQLEYDRIAVVDLAALVPLLRAGLPLKWHLGSNDKPCVKLRWRRPTGSIKGLDMPVARLLFNAPSERYCRFVWSPLLLTEKAWLLSKALKRGTRVKNDPMTCLKLHDAHMRQTKGEGYMNYRDVRSVLVPPEKCLLDLFATKAR